MIVRAHAKINLALAVGARRDDGYHELTTLFQTVELADELQLEPDDRLELEVVGDAPAGADNLVLRAAELLRQHSGCKAGARITLRKRIPTGGGLGGGSSDAAATLSGLDSLWGTGADGVDLHRLASELGSDVPYFLLGGTALGLGRGEQLFALTELPQHHVVLALPGFSMSTAAVFAERARLAAGRPRNRPCIDSWRFARLWDWQPGALAGLGNDLERCAEALRPELASHRRALEGAGAALARLSGTGSTSFGLFATAEEADAAVLRLGEIGCPGVRTETFTRAGLAGGG